MVTSKGYVDGARLAAQRPTGQEAGPTYCSGGAVEGARRWCVACSYA
jgi:hypothetical protein